MKVFVPLASILLLASPALAVEQAPSQWMMSQRAFPDKNDEVALYLLVLRDVPVDGFWSVTVYEKDGYMPQNPKGRNAVNNVKAVKGDDGAVTVRIGGCDV